MVLAYKGFMVSCKNRRNPSNFYNTKQNNITREIGAKNHGGSGERQVGLG